MVEQKRPGGALSRRKLRFIWLADCSGSMGERGKIQSLNHAIREALPHMREAAANNPHAEIMVQALKFSHVCEWHVAKPTPVEKFTWTDLTAGGETAMGMALELVAQELTTENIGSRGLPPVLVLVSDGQPTDNFKKGLKKLLESPWGSRAIRIGIAIGDHADLGVLRSFMNNPEVEPLEAKNPEALVKHIRWVSTSVLTAASSPRSKSSAARVKGISVDVPSPPQVDNAEAVF